MYVCMYVYLNEYVCMYVCMYLLYVCMYLLYVCMYIIIRYSSLFLNVDLRIMCCINTYFNYSIVEPI